MVYLLLGYGAKLGVVDKTASKGAASQDMKEAKHFQKLGFVLFALDKVAAIALLAKPPIFGQDGTILLLGDSFEIAIFDMSEIERIKPQKPQRLGQLRQMDVGYKFGSIHGLSIEA